MKRRSQRGFTFIEMIVALSIFGLVMTGLYATFHVAQQGMEAGKVRAETSQIGRVVLDEIGRDLMNVYPLHVDSEEVDPELVESLEGVTIDLVFIGEDHPPRSSEEKEQDSLSLVTCREPKPGENQVGFDLMEVTYLIDDDPATPESGLVKIINRVPGLAAETTEPEVEEFSDRVVSLNFRYLNPETQEWEDEWISGSTLPQAVEISLEIDPVDERAEPVFTMGVVRLRNLVGTAGAQPRKSTKEGGEKPPEQQEPEGGEPGSGPEVPGPAAGVSPGMGGGRP